MIPSPTIIIDSDVWIAALVIGGKPRQVLIRAIQEGQTIVVSEAILRKIRHGLFGILPAFIAEFEALLVALRCRLQMVELGYNMGADTNIALKGVDRSVLETAIASEANVIITGNYELLKLGAYQEILIIPPQVW